MTPGPGGGYHPALPGPQIGQGVKNERNRHKLTYQVISKGKAFRDGGVMMGEFRIKRLEPVHDPDAYERVVRILGTGLRRGLLRLREEDHPQRPPSDKCDSLV